VEDAQLGLVARVAEKVERAKFVIGRRLHDARLSKRLSQVSLAQASGVSLRCIQQVEHGEVMVDNATLYYLGEVVGVEPAEFLQGLG
jgi:transcriptional regulator with XRE-family HTH domain